MIHNKIVLDTNIVSYIIKEHELTEAYYPLV